MHLIKRVSSVFLALVLLAGALPAALAAQSWEEALAASREAGLEVTWYPDYEGLTRLYGTERMLLQQNGLYALCDLGGTQYTGFVFDAVEQPSADGTILAMKNGKWGKIDQNGNTLVDFVHDTKELAAHPVSVQILQQGGLFAVADLEGNLLTGYDYWNAKGFVNGYAALQNNQGLWGYIDGSGRVAVPFRYESDRYAVGDMGEDGFAIIQTFFRGCRVVNTRGEELFETGMSKIWRAGQGMWGFSENAVSGGGGTIGFADSQGNIVVEPQYTYYTSPKGELYGGIFDQNGVAEVYTGFGHGARVLIDTSGTVLESYPAASVRQEDSQGLYMTELVPSIGPWGFQDAGGNLVVPYLYEAAGRFEYGFASVRAGGVYGLLRHPLLCSDWAEEELSAAQANGYVTDRCRFYRMDAITRLQFAELAVNYLEKAIGQAMEPAAPDTFADTADTAVLKAYAAGIVQGRGEGIFDPNGLLTRQELAAMLYRAMSEAGVEFDGTELDFDAYADGAQVDSWAREPMSAVVNAGVLKGTGENRLSPWDGCTVEQAILLVWRAAA